MIRVRRRPKLVEALQFDGTPDGVRCLKAFTPAISGPFPVGTVVRLTTARGPVAVQPGDWLIRNRGTPDIAVVTNEQFFRDYDHVGADDDTVSA